MFWEVGHQDGTGRDGMYEFEREELTRTDEAAVVFVDKVECKEGKQIGKSKVNGEVRVGIAYEVEPVFPGEGEGRIWICEGSMK